MRTIKVSPYLQLGGSLVAAVVLAATGAGAQDDMAGPACGQFEVISKGTGRTATFVDVPPDGPSAGDMRIGIRQLETAAGEPIGRFRWIATDLEPTASEERGIGFLKSLMVFENGTLIYEHVYEPASKNPDVSRSTTREGFRYITGGTGDFNGATGTVHITKQDGNDETYSFDITCPSAG